MEIKIVNSSLELKRKCPENCRFLNVTRDKKSKKNKTRKFFFSVLGNRANPLLQWHHHRQVFFLPRISMRDICFKEVVDTKPPLLPLPVCPIPRPGLQCTCVLHKGCETDPADDLKIDPGETFHSNVQSSKRMDWLRVQLYMYRTSHSRGNIPSSAEIVDFLVEVTKEGLDMYLIS